MGGKYQAYPEYKYSGIEWLGFIPTAWQMWKLTHVYECIGSGTTPPSDTGEWYDGDVPWVTTGELRESVITSTIKNITLSTVRKFPTLRIYPKNSIAIAMYGATIGRLGIFGVEATTNQACCVLTKSHILDNKYLYYWLQAFRQDIVNLASGGGQPNINQEVVGSLKVSSPNLNEQQKIANFLDHQTAKIDTLIAKQQQLIALLKEKRQAVISHAVTKGLNPNAPMRDSGVEWLGEVPAHWRVSKFNYEIDFLEGPGILAYDFFEEGVPLLRIQDVKEKFVTDNYKTFLSPLKVRDKWEHFRVNLGDLIISCSASTGLVSEVDSRSVGAVPYTGLIRLRPLSNRITKDFICFIVQSDIFFEQINHLQTGSTMQHFGPYHLQQMHITLPPLHEQKILVQHIEKVIANIDSLVDKAEQAIELIQERRTALISAAVTGKIDVRDWQAPKNSNNANNNNKE